MWQLIIDTSHTHLSLGLLKDGFFIDGVCEMAHKTQSERIMPCLETLLSRHALKTHNLKQVYVGIGPGSYTGVRIGLTVAKVLCLIHNLEVFSFFTYDFLLAQDTGTVILDARSSRAYVGVKKNREWTFQGIMSQEDILLKTHEPYVGDAYLIDREDVLLAFQTRCEHVIQVSDKVSDVHGLEPLYLKPL